MPTATAETIVRTLGGNRSGAHWMARCPAHDDKSPSLSVRDTDDGRVLVYCHAGCRQSEVIAALRDRGLCPSNGHQGPDVVCAGRAVVARFSEDGDQKRQIFALRLWQESGPAEHSPVEFYFKARGLNTAIPPSLRYNPALAHRSGGKWPAMIALVTRGADARAVGVHRTYLRADGAAKAPVTPHKMMLGHCRGGAVRLASPASPLMIAEGIETALSAMQATGLAAWAALSAPGLVALDLPLEFRDLILLADGDPPGERAVRQAAARWHKEGRRVRVARAPQGQDFNDLLQASASDCEASQP